MKATLHFFKKMFHVYTTENTELRAGQDLKSTSLVSYVFSFTAGPTENSKSPAAP